MMDDAVNITAGCRVNTAGRLIHDHQLRFGGKRTADDHLLLIAAGEAAGHLFMAHGLDAEIADIFIADLILIFLIQQ